MSTADLFLAGAACGVAGIVLAAAVLWWDWYLDDRGSGK